MPRQKLFCLLRLGHDLVGGRLPDVARRRRDLGRHLNDASALLRLLGFDDDGGGDVLDALVDDRELFVVLPVVRLGFAEAARLRHDRDL